MTTPAQPAFVERAPLSAVVEAEAAALVVAAAVVAGLVAAGVEAAPVGGG